MMDAYETLTLFLLYVNDMDQDKISTFEYICSWMIQFQKRVM